MNWRHISSAPKDGTPIEGLYESGPCLVRWAQHRQCMLAGIGGGNGYFGPGWEDEENHLIADEPMAWREEVEITDRTDELEKEIGHWIGVSYAMAEALKTCEDGPETLNGYNRDFCPYMVANAQRLFKIIYTKKFPEGKLP